MTILLMAASMLAVHNAGAQTKTALEKLLISSDSLFSLSKSRVDAYCLKHSVSRSYSEDDRVYLMIDVTPTGEPLYIKTDNAGVASSIGVNQLRSGGSLGIDILGADLKVGVWDGGRIRNSHVEFGDRVQNSDGASANSNHATHVMGTIVASGVNSSARGMAPESLVVAYDFDNDLSEMTNLARPDQTTLLLSNHSYGTLAGWDQGSNGTWTWYGDPSISTTEDYKFGFYDSRSRLWDQLAYNAPYYTIVKSAGNDRADTGDGSRPPDGPYNSISTYGNAKNIITVGAVSKVLNYSGPQSVQMSNFSSWGPTDDGRIKPDLVAPGVNIFSTSSSSDDSYSQLNGTSMAAPAITGGLSLLQQLYSQVNNGNFMRAATLKALAIHTAKEAGSLPGPDYQFGWGLLDVEAGAKFILYVDGTNNQIIEGNILNNEVFEVELYPVANEKITATLVWTDPAGTPPPNSLNPNTLMLVNDLDLRIVDEEGVEQFPWVLNPSSPGLGASRADNFRDNVEKIEFDSPLPRKYFLRVKHKGPLTNGQQNFSLIISYTSINETRQTYYWINGSGDWSDGLHWSLSSGGPSTNTVPTSNDRVVFDGNSFSDNGNFVNVTASQSIYSFSWFCQSEVNFNFNSQAITIHEDVLILNDKMLINSPGVFKMHALDENVHSISSSQKNLQNLDFHFTNGNWKLNTDINVNHIIVEKGNVDLAQRQIRLNGIKDIDSSEKKISLMGTSISAEPGFKLTLNHNTKLLTDSNTEIQVKSVNQSELVFGSNYFEGSILLLDGAVLLSESEGIHRIVGKGSITYNSDLFTSELDLQGGSTVIIGPSTKQTFSHNLFLRTSTEQPILISGNTENKGIISISGNYKLCFNHLILENIDYVGEATVNIGQFSQLTNAEGWLEENCDDLLFADFEVLYACENAYAYTVNNSSGNITSYLWYINEELISSDKDFVFKIQDLDELGIRLEVQDGVSSRSFTKSISPIINPLLPNYLVLSDSRLISFRSATSYQWMLNGDIIQGENERFINYDFSSGVYSVLTFSDVCNIESEPFIIANLENSFLLQAAYPNPVLDYLNVSTNEFIVRCLGYDISGRMIELDFLHTQSGITVDLQKKLPGVYIIEIVSSRGTTQRIRVLKK